MRNLIGRVIEGEEGLSVAGKAMNGKFALQKLERLNPDVIILDLEMPEMNGIEFLKERKKRGIDVPVVILSSIAKKGAKITMEALSLGASDFIMKPSGPVSEDIKTIGRHLSDAVRAYGLNYQKKRGIVITETPAPQTQARRRAVEADTAAALGEKEKAAVKPIEPLAEFPERKAAPIEIVAIGISTGGPNALREVFSQVEADMPVPIVVVQHMPAGFTEEFAKSLDKISPLEISEAKDGDVLKPGRVLIAPGNYHMEVEKKRLAPVVTLNSNPPVNGHRPSVDVLFSSIAKNFGGRSLAVIMTGMGKDGAREIGEIRRAGGITIAQDQGSCVVFGMPKVAYDNGFIQHLVPLKVISGLIGKIIKENN
jgi:two-component system, chemotaxis family, protein-glutamate methylesterase/glutaminase